MTYQVIYLSNSIYEFDENQLVNLLMKARIHNEENGITGLLIYKDGQFVQYLEGEKEKVNALLKRIEKDKRHKGIFYIMRKLSNSERLFMEWKMGFHHMRYLDKMDISGLAQTDMAEIKTILENKKNDYASIILSNVIESNT